MNTYRSPLAEQRVPAERRRVPSRRTVARAADITAVSPPPPLPDSARRIALLLGVAGLVPFAALALGAWFAPPVAMPIAVMSQTIYGAAILSFLGGLHWGFALSGRLGTRATGAAIAWGVVPSLIAWTAAQSPAPASLVLLAGGLALAWAIDQRAWRDYGVGTWFLHLRSLLTVVAVLALLATALAPVAAGRI